MQYKYWNNEYFNKTKIIIIFLTEIVIVSQ